MKKWTALLMAVMLLALPLLAGAEGTEETVYPEELLVGNPTEMKGDFFTEMFGNNTSDIDMKALIHGYNLVSWDENQGEYRFDPTVVTDTLLTENEEGDHTYYLALARDLYYCDGTPITAWDYAFSLLLQMRPEIEQIGGKVYRQEHLLGYAAYVTGGLDHLVGVHVVTDYQLAITLDGDFLPFFYEVGLLLCEPYPISVIAPGCKVYDDGEGVYIANEDATVTEPLFTAELLRKTILDPETGYLSHPAVTAGPYKLVSFDGVTAHAELNPYYKGKWVKLPEEPAAEGEETVTFDEEGAEEAAEAPIPQNYTPVTDEEGNLLYYLSKPAIAKISFTCVKSEEVPQLFADGQIHLVNKMVYGPAIQEMIQKRNEAIGTAAEEELPLDAEAEAEAVATEEPAEETVETAAETQEQPEAAEETQATGEEPYRLQNYPRLGMTFLTFSCDWPTVHEKEVRQAIAWCMDRDAITRDYTGSYGVRVDGYYGIEKWEYMLVDDRLDPPVTMVPAGEQAPHDFANMYATSDAEYEQMVTAWQELNLDNLTVYTVDTEKAAALLDGAGWTLNEEGIRQKEINGETVTLDMKLLYPEGNLIAESLEANLLKNLEQVGIRVTLVPAPMDELLSQYYHQTDRTADMIYLGTNFHVVFDPSITYSTVQNARWNNTFSDDTELYRLAEDMRKTAPRDVFNYVSKWIRFQERYNEVLPAIPVYSNVYFDFYVPYLQNYNVASHTTWSQAIEESYFGEDIPAPEPAEEPAEGETIE